MIRFATILVAIFTTITLSHAQTAKKDPTPSAKDSYKDVKPEIGGKDIDTWIKEIENKDPSKREAAIRAVVGFGPELAYRGIPAMLKQLKLHNPSTYPLDTSVRVNLVIALGVILGEKSDADPRVEADVVAQLIRFTKDSQAIVRFRAAQSLGNLHDGAKAAVPDLLVLLKDNTTWEIRQAACVALGKVAVDTKAGPSTIVLTSLFSTLQDSAVHVRMSAIQSLTYLGPPSDEKTKYNLLKALEGVANKDTEPIVQIWAHMAIMSVTNNIAAEHIVPVGKMTSHKEAAVRSQAIQALGAVGSRATTSTAKIVLPFLMNGLTDTEPNLIAESIMALTQMSTHAKDAAPVLEKLSSNMSHPEALRKLAKDASEFVQGKKK